MISKPIQIIYGVILSGLFLLPSFSTLASDISVGASITVRSSISATKGQDMNFGAVDFDPIHTGSIQLGTNGSVTLGGGASGLNLNGGTPTAGDVTIGGDGQSMIEISCENTGILGGAGASTLNLSNVQFSIDVGQSFGGATSCAGLGNSPATIDLSVNAAPQILFGAALDVSGSAISTSGSYSTAAAGGDPVTMRVVYQ